MSRKVPKADQFKTRMVTEDEAREFCLELRALREEYMEWVYCASYQQLLFRRAINNRVDQKIKEGNPKEVLTSG